MPFVPQACRDPNHVPCSVGDMCFKEYAAIMKIWRENPRWTTAHDQFRFLFDCSDEQAAKALAFFVFFAKHIMPYEDIKEKDNGTV